MNLQEIRQQYPQYDDLTDEQLATGIHKKFYSDMPFEDFSARVGYVPPAPEPSAFDNVMTALKDNVTDTLSSAPDLGTLKQKNEDLGAATSMVLNTLLNSPRMMMGLDPKIQPSTAEDVGAMGAAATNATLGLSEQLWRTPETLTRFYGALSEFSTGEPLDPRQNPFSYISEGFTIPGTDIKLEGTTNVAEGISNFRNQLPEHFEPFRTVMEKNQKANVASAEAAAGNLEMLADVVQDPVAVSAFVGNAIPSLYAAWKSGGSMPFIAWLEGMDAANNAADFERETGKKMTDQQYSNAVIQVAAVNTFLEKYGLDKLVKGTGNAVTRFFKGFATEAGTETAQEFNQNLAEKVNYNQKKALTENLVQAGIGGGFSGGAAGVALGSDTQQTKAEPDNIEDIMKGFKPGPDTTTQEPKPDQPRLPGPDRGALETPVQPQKDVPRITDRLGKVEQGYREKEAQDELQREADALERHMDLDKVTSPEARIMRGLERADIEREYTGADETQMEKAMRDVVKPDSVGEPARQLKADRPGGATADFFTRMTLGKDGIPDVEYEPVVDVGDKDEFVQEYVKHQGHFDSHIRASIPSFGESQVLVGDAIIKTQQGSSNVLDIGASEGSWAKTLTSLSDGKIKTDSVDPLPAMKQQFDKTPVPGANFYMEGFGAGWTEDDGTVINEFKPGKKYDVVHESMTFQFIENDRPTQFERVKSMMKPNGIFITEEKFRDDGSREYADREAQKDDYKSKYFTQEAIKNKEKETLVVGMNDNMATQQELEQALTDKFKYVVQYWHAGNFGGYAASDNKARLDAFLGNLNDLSSEYTPGKMPRWVSRGAIAPESVGEPTPHVMEEPVQGFYSPMAKEIMKGPKKADPQQWIQFLENAVKNGRIKQEELDDSKLIPFLQNGIVRTQYGWYQLTKDKTTYLEADGKVKRESLNDFLADTGHGVIDRLAFKGSSEEATSFEWTMEHLDGQEVWYMEDDSGNRMFEITKEPGMPWQLKVGDNYRNDFPLKDGDVRIQRRVDEDYESGQTANEAMDTVLANLMQHPDGASWISRYIYDIGDASYSQWERAVDGRANELALLTYGEISRNLVDAGEQSNKAKDIIGTAGELNYKYSNLASHRMQGRSIEEIIGAQRLMGPQSVLWHDFDDLAGANPEIAADTEELRRISRAIRAVWDMQRPDMEYEEADAARYQGIRLGGEDAAAEDYTENLYRKPIDEEAQYSEPHWMEGDDVIFHERSDTRKTQDGDTTYHVSEWQSTLHQAGRQRGYKGETFSYQSGGREYAVPLGYSFKKEIRPGIGYVIHQLVRDSDGTVVAEGPDRGEAIERSGMRNLVPNYPYKTGWKLRAFKQSLKNAIDQGADWLTWSTGAQVADFEGVGVVADRLEYKVDAVNSLDYIKEHSLGGIFSAYKNGKKRRSWPAGPTKVREYIGEELAEKLLNTEPRLEQDEFGSKWWQWEISGEDLGVKAGPMVAFYDVDMKTRIAKYLRQHFGKDNKVQVNTLDSGDKVWAIKLTDEIKQSVNEMGQPAYLRGMGIPNKNTPVHGRNIPIRSPFDLKKENIRRDLNVEVVDEYQAGMGLSAAAVGFVELTIQQQEMIARMADGLIQQGMAEQAAQGVDLYLAHPSNLNSGYATLFDFTSSDGRYRSAVILSSETIEIANQGEHGGFSARFTLAHEIGHTIEALHSRRMSDGGAPQTMGVSNYAKGFKLNHNYPGMSGEIILEFLHTFLSAKRKGNGLDGIASYPVRIWISYMDARKMGTVKQFLTDNNLASEERVDVLIQRETFAQGWALYNTVYRTPEGKKLLDDVMPQTMKMMEAVNDNLRTTRPGDGSAEAVRRALRVDNQLGVPVRGQGIGTSALPGPTDRGPAQVNQPVAGSEPGGQTNTPAFKRWFGDSKVVDAEGKPLVVYHGTEAAGFTEFGLDRKYGSAIPLERQDIGFHFGTKGQANEILFIEDRVTGENVPKDAPEGGEGIYPVYLSIKNPLDFPVDTGFTWASIFMDVAEDRTTLTRGMPRNEFEDLKNGTMGDVREWLQSLGYDGIRYINEVEDPESRNESWIAFEQSQIKSAVGNRGTFDPEMADITAQRKPRTRSTKYIGGPPGGRSRTGFGSLQDLFASLAQEGVNYREWYKRSAQFIMEMTGSNLAEAEKLAQLIAITSSTTKVLHNGHFAVKGWLQYKAGDKINTGKYPGSMSGAIDNLLNKGIPWPGRKRNSFYINLMIEMDPTAVDRVYHNESGDIILLDKNEQPGEGYEKINVPITADMWIARLLGYPTDALTNNQYEYIEIMGQNVAELLGWGVHEVQAGAWVAFKARWDETINETKQYALKNKWAHIDDDGKFIVDEPKKFRTRARNMALKHKPTPQEMEKAGVDYRDSLERILAQVAFEAKPSKASGILPGIHEADMAPIMRHYMSIQNLLTDPQGRDIIDKKLGMLGQGMQPGPSAWELAVGWGGQSMVLMPGKKGAGGEADPSAMKLATVKAAILGKILTQDVVGIIRPYKEKVKGRQNLTAIDLGRDPSVEDVERLYGLLYERLGDQEMAPIHWPGKGVFVPHKKTGRELIAERKQVVEIANEAFAQVRSVEGLGANLVLIMNDYQENPNGETYNETIRQFGGDELLQWVEDNLSTGVAAINSFFERQERWGPDVTGTEPGQRFPVNADGTVTLRHWSNQSNLTETDPAFYGQGIRGEEAKRMSDPNWVPRSYYGLPTYRKEPGLGVHMYETRVPLGELYNASQDPDGLRPKPFDATQYEAAISEAGYRGYYADNSEKVAIFGKLPVQKSTAPRGEAILPSGMGVPLALPADQAREKFRAKIGKEKEPIYKQLMNIFNAETFVHEILDSGLPFRRMVEELGPVEAIEDPYKAWRLLAGDAPIIEDWIGISPRTAGGAPFDPTEKLDVNRYGMSLREAIGENILFNESRLEDLEMYLIARRAQHLLRAGKEHLFDEEDIQYGLDLVDPELDAAADRIYFFQDNLLEYAVQGGLLDRETAQKFMDMSDYIPFFRESEPTAGRGKQSANVFKRLKGGLENVRHPLQNLIDNTATIIHATNRNAVILRAIQLHDATADLEDAPKWLERVPVPRAAVRVATDQIVENFLNNQVDIDRDAAEQMAVMQTFFVSKPLGDDRNQILVAKENGKNIAVKILDDQLWKTLKGFSADELGIIVDILAIPAKTVRTGVVMSPEFMARNFFRDSLSGYIQARGHQMIPVFHTLAGFKHGITASEIYRLFRAFGGGFADMWHGDSQAAAMSLKRLANIQNKPMIVLNPMNWWRALQWAGGITETGTRTKAFEQVFNTQGRDANAAINAALEAREISVDFGMHGAAKAMRIFERITPFVNPMKQGLYKMGRTFNEHPVATLMRGMPLVLMSILLWWLYKDEEWYQELEDWEKNMYWHADIGARTEDGLVIPARMPKPFEYGATFGSFWEAGLEALEADEATWERTMSIIQDVFLLRGVPPSIGVPVEQWANKSFFTGRPIVTEREQSLENFLQYSAGTSDTARALGESLDMSPKRIDAGVRGLFGTMGMYGMQVADHPVRRLKGYPEGEEKSWWQMPLVKVFFKDPTRSSSRQVTEFYDLLQEVRKQDASLRYLEFSPEEYERYQDAILSEGGAVFVAPSANDFAGMMSELRAANRNIRDDRDLTPAQKAVLIRQNNQAIKYSAKMGLELLKEADNAIK